VLDLGRDEAGKRTRRWHAGFTSAAEAEKARTSLLAAIDEHRYVAPTKITVKTFIEDRWLPALEALVAAGKLKPSTVAQYRNLVNAYVVPRLGRVVLRELTPDELARFHGALFTSGRRRAAGARTGLSTTTVHAIHVACHRMLKDAQRWGIVARNVADVASADAPRPAEPSIEGRVWSPAELGAFLRAMSGTRLAALWILFATTGIRRGEAAGLRWSDVDLEAGELAVRRAGSSSTMPWSSPRRRRRRAAARSLST
jgi:integrase